MKILTSRNLTFRHNKLVICKLNNPFTSVFQWNVGLLAVSYNITAIKCIILVFLILPLELKVLNYQLERRCVIFHVYVSSLSHFFRRKYFNNFLVKRENNIQNHKKLKKKKRESKELITLITSMTFIFSF